MRAFLYVNIHVQIYNFNYNQPKKYEKFICQYNIIKSFLFELTTIKNSHEQNISLM